MEFKPLFDGTLFSLQHICLIVILSRGGALPYTEVRHVPRRRVFFDERFPTQGSCTLLLFPTPGCVLLRCMEISLQVGTQISITYG